MPAVELALAAVHDLDELIQSRSLPPDTRSLVSRTRRSAAPPMSLRATAGADPSDPCDMF